MTLVEGVGDEVTLILVLLTIILVVLIAWLSTHTHDIPFYSVIVIELSQRAARNQRQNDQVSADAQAVSSTGENAVSTDSTIASTDEQAVSTDNTVASSGERAVSTDSTVTSTDEQVVSTDSTVASTDKPTVSTESTTDEQATAYKAEGNVSQVVTESIRHQDLKHKDVNVDADEKTRLYDSKNVSGIVNKSENTLLSSGDSIVSGPKANTDNENKENYRLPPSDVKAFGGPSIPEFTSLHRRNVPSTSKEDVCSVQSNIERRDVRSADSSPNVSNNGENEGQIRIRLKYLNDTQRLVYSSPSETIGQFKRAHFSTELAANKLVRLIFNGRDMRNETNTLQRYNITDNAVVHCLVTQNIQTSPASQQVNGDADAQLGSFMLPLFAIILSIVWYFRVTQRQYFNAISTLSLAGLTFLFLLGCATVVRGRVRTDEPTVLE